MQRLTNFFRRLPVVALLAALPFAVSGKSYLETIAAHYHFAGAANLPPTAGFGSARRVFALGSSHQFVGLVYNRLAAELEQSLQWPTLHDTSALAGLVNDAVMAESVGSFSAWANPNIDFVIAIRLDSQRAQQWQRTLESAANRAATKFTVDGFNGWQWNQGTLNVFYLVPARDWLVVGRGVGMDGERSQFLQQIQKTGQPAPSLKATWFEADLDGPRLAQWPTMAKFPFKMGRVHLGIANQGQNFRMEGRVTYASPVPWRSEPWRIPASLVREPLVAFSAGQDVEAFFKAEDALTRNGATAFRDQFYFWAMGEMPFQSYLAWPVNNTSSALRDFATRAPQDLNPALRKINGSELAYHPAQNELLWSKLQVIVPNLKGAPPSAGQFLVASLFALTPGKKPAPDALFEQFKNRSEMVYYDWELTGPRVRQLRTAAEILPILQMAGIPSGPRAPSAERQRLLIEEHWLEGLTPLLGNTVTEVTRGSPTQLDITRVSPFVFTSLELVLLSHWLSDTSAGPLDWTLLPQAKISGPGLPH